MQAKQAIQWAVLCAAALANGCSGGGAETGGGANVQESKPALAERSKLWLSSSSKGEDVTVTVNFELGPAPAPRVAEVRLAHDEQLTLVDAVPGEGAKAAGKELTVQQPEPNLVRLILLSRDGGSLKSGSLAVLHLRKHGGQPAKIDILTDKPPFAPAEAMQGLSIGDPLQL